MLYRILPDEKGSCRDEPTMARLRRRSSRSASAMKKTISAPSPAYISTSKESATTDRVQIQVRAKVICNSDNLHGLYQEQQQQQLSKPEEFVTTVYNADAPPPRRHQLQEDMWSEEALQEAFDLWKLSDDEIAEFMDLARRLKDCSHHFKYDPHIVLRFMTGPNGKDAENSFRQMIQWRKENNIDKVLDEYKPHPLLLEHNPTAILKDYDRDGDPIYVERGGAADGLGMLRWFSREELMRYAVWTRELNTQGAWLEEYERRQGRKVKDLTVVYDLKGLNANHLRPQVLDFFGAVQTLNAERYPGSIKRVIIIRAPKIFQICWKIVRHFFPQSAQEKMIFAGKDYHEVLEKYMDLDVLPPCIYEHGKGEAAAGLPPRMEGGMLPPVEKGGPLRAKAPLGSVVNSSPSAKPFQAMETSDTSNSDATEQGSLSDNSYSQ